MNNRPSKTAVTECDGSDTCPATSHLLGCYALRGKTLSHAAGEAAAAADPRITHLGDGYISFDLPVYRTAAIHPTIYIAGPMSGHQDFNYHAFHYAAADLRAAGYRILNPAENPKPNPDPSWQDWMRAALGQLIQADAIALLPGYTKSKGALIEERIGRDLGLDVRHIVDWLPGQINISLYTPSAATK